jgi:hypothetical protein
MVPSSAAEEMGRRGRLAAVAVAGQLPEWGGGGRCCHVRFLHVERVDHLPTIHPGINNNSSENDPYGKKKMKKLRTQRRKRQEEEKARRRDDKSARPSHRIIDRIRLQVSGGRGGNGSLSLHRISRKRHFQPDGGHGGHGGSVLLIADPHCTSLKGFRPHASAQKGANGSNNQCHGGRGRNIVLRVPPGVVVKRILDDDDEWDEETKSVVRTMSAVEEDYEDEDDDEDEDNDDDNEIRWDKKDGFVNSDYDDNTYEEDGEEHDDGESEVDPSVDPDGSTADDSDEPRRRGTADAWYLDDDGNIPDEAVARRTVTVADLDSPGSYVVVARGGLGGRGETFFFFSGNLIVAFPRCPNYLDLLISFIFLR